MATKANAGFRFSLQWLLIGIAVWAFGITALLNSNNAWLSIVVTASALAWMAAVLLAIFSAASPKAFAIGVSLWGALYIGLAYLLGHTKMLVTSQILDFVYDRVSKTTTQTNVFGATEIISLPEYGQFVLIGQMLWAWVLAICGGVLARFIYQQYHHGRG